MDLSNTSRTEPYEPKPSTSAVADSLSIPVQPLIPNAKTDINPLTSTSRTTKFDEEIFFVDKILKKRVNNKGDVQYYVKWKNYDSRHNTWEPASSFNDQALIENWEARRKRGKKMSRGGKTRKLAKLVSESSSAASDSCSVSTKSSSDGPEPSEGSSDIDRKPQPLKKKIITKRARRNDKIGRPSPEASTSASTSTLESAVDGKRKPKHSMEVKKKKKTFLNKIIDKIIADNGPQSKIKKPEDTPVKSEASTRVSKMDLLLSQKKLTPEKVPKKKKKKTEIIKTKSGLDLMKKKLKATKLNSKKKVKVEEAREVSNAKPVRDNTFHDTTSRDFAMQYIEKNDPSVMIEMTIIKDGDKEILFEEIRFGPGAVRRSEPLRQ